MELFKEKIQAALAAFQALFSDDKTRKSKERWKDYFLSETFLEVQFSGNCLRQMQDYLKKQEMVSYKELPPGFLFELVTAYGLEPLIDEHRGLIQADFMEDSFYKKELSAWWVEFGSAMRTVAEIWNAQDASWRRDRGGRSIRKWEYRLRGRAFADYIELCVKYDAGVQDWEEDYERGGPLSRGKWHYIQTGRYNQNSYGDFVRNECILLLYAYFLRTHKLPKAAYVWLWKLYELSEMKAGQQVRAYEGIRQAILMQCPSVEATADEEKMAQEQYNSWTRRLNDLERKYQYDGWAVKPNVPFEYTYALSVPEVSEQELQELQELFDSPVFHAYKYDDELLWDLDYHCAGGNATPALAATLYRVYMDSRDKSPRINTLLEHVRARMSYFERIPEYLCQVPFVYDCSTKAPDFWYYYLMMAFEGRCVEDHTPEDDFSYIEGRMIRKGRKYLSGYLEQLYHPSMEWRRRFVGSDMTGRIDKPRRMEIRLCPEQGRGGELVIEIEFHLHSIQFYWNGKVWEGQETLSFQELLQCAGAEGDEERFVLLLALTDIETSEHWVAREEIRSRLGKLPIDEFCLDFVAECLANGDSRAEKRNQYGGRFAYVYRDGEAYGCGNDVSFDDDSGDGGDYDDDIVDGKVCDGNREDVDEDNRDKYGNDYDGSEEYDDIDDEECGDDNDDSDEYDDDEAYEYDEEYDDDEYDDDDEEVDEDDDEYDEDYQDFDYNANNDDMKNGLGGQETRFAENLTGRYCARLDVSGGIVYSRYGFCGWQAIRPSKWSLWEACRGLVRYGLRSLGASEKKRVVVRGMSDLEKAQQICALLEENHQPSLIQHRTNQQWLEKCGILAGNSVVLCYGEWDSCYLEKTLITGLFTEKKSMQDAYAITKKEKNYQVGWLFQDWDAYKTLIAVGESGALWYYGNFSPPRAVSADSLAEVIANRFRLAEVTAIYLRGNHDPD